MAIHPTTHGTSSLPFFNLHLEATQSNIACGVRNARVRGFMRESQSLRDMSDENQVLEQSVELRWESGMKTRSAPPCQENLWRSEIPEDFLDTGLELRSESGKNQVSIR